MDNWLTLEGPVESIEDRLFISVPLSEGGNQFIRCTHGIAQVDLERECLNIYIPDGLVQKIGISEGVQVVISNEGGQFHLWLA